MRRLSLIGKCPKCCTRTVIPPPTVSVECRYTVAGVDKTLAGWTGFYPGIPTDYPGGYWAGGTRKFRQWTQGGGAGLELHLRPGCNNCYQVNQYSWAGSWVWGGTDNRTLRAVEERPCGTIISDHTQATIGIVYGWTDHPRCGAPPPSYANLWCVLQTVSRRQMGEAQACGDPGFGSYSYVPTPGTNAFDQFSDEIFPFDEFDDVSYPADEDCCTLTATFSTEYRAPLSNQPLTFRAGSRAVRLRLFGTGKPLTQYRVTYSYSSSPDPDVVVETVIETDSLGEYEFFSYIPMAPPGRSNCYNADATIEEVT